MSVPDLMSGLPDITYSPNIAKVKIVVDIIPGNANGNTILYIVPILNSHLGRFFQFFGTAAICGIRIQAT